jgi:maltose-binding protein MalE
MGKDFLSGFSAAPVASSTYNGTVYMIPDRFGNELCLLYNKTLVSAAPTSWDEMIRIGKTLEEEGRVLFPVAFNMDEPFFSIPMLASFGGQVFDNPSSNKARPTLATPQVKKWAEWLVKIHREGQIPEKADYDTASELFQDGKVPFLINGPWSFLNYAETYSMNFGVAPIPKINGKWPAPYYAVKGYSVNRAVLDSPDKKEACRLFIKFVTSKNCQIRMAKINKTLPSIISALKDKEITDDPLLMGQIDSIEKGIPIPVIPQMRAIWDAIKPVQNQLFDGKVSPAEAPALMQKNAEEGIKALGLEQ